MTKRQRFAKECYHVVGWGLKSWLGDPDQPMFAAAEIADAFGEVPKGMTDAGAATQIDEIVKQCGGVDGFSAAAIPWPLIRPVLAFLAQKLIELLLKKEEAGG